MAQAADFKITSAEANNVHVQGQPDILQGSAQQNKAAFDAYSELIRNRFNGLCDFIDTDTSTVIDRDVLEYYVSIGWIPDND